MRNDPFLPLVDANYFYGTGETKWIAVNAGTLATLLDSDNPPECRTVLGILADTSQECPQSGWPYLGPLYMDFDGETLEDAIAGFIAMLGRLEAMGIDLESVRLFASGGRGFHIEIPMECFMGKVPGVGVVNLPYIYRGMAEALNEPTLDTRVYSVRRGRFWRVPNRQRANGQFKVPLTVPEALAITLASYADLTSAPRPFPTLARPTLNSELGFLYVTSRDKAMASATRKAATSKEVAEIQRRFGNKLPPVLAALGQGRFPARGGFNQIVLQMSLAAQAVGMDEDTLLDACEGLIQKHESDGHRYDTPTKRRTELRAMFRYTDSSSYTFSVGGVWSILPKGLKCNDFRGL
jgi:hypothetical protein